LDVLSTGSSSSTDSGPSGTIESIEGQQKQQKTLHNHKALPENLAASRYAAVAPVAAAVSTVKISCSYEDQCQLQYDYIKYSHHEPCHLLPLHTLPFVPPQNLALLDCHA